MAHPRKDAEPTEVTVMGEAGLPPRGILIVEDDEGARNKLQALLQTDRDYESTPPRMAIRPCSGCSKIIIPSSSPICGCPVSTACNSSRRFSAAGCR